jgi:hypothetical protein
MEKEKWIQEVFDSASKLERAEPSPFLVEKIMTRIKGESADNREAYGFKWALGLVALLIIAINIVSLGRLVHDKKEVGKITLQKSTGINNEVIYNY